MSATAEAPSRVRTDACGTVRTDACGAGSCWLAAEKSRATTWAATSLPLRLHVLRAARHRMAAQAQAFAAAISPQLERSQADTLVTELLPLLDACKFLEKNAARILKPRTLGRAGRAFWLGGVWAEIHREPLGHVLVIGPANFPLFLAGTQVLQALAAGNTVTWKPGEGGAPVAALVASALRDAGLPEGTLTVTADTEEAGKSALAAGADKVIFTGSNAVGKRVLAELAATATPAVMELSGADAVIVMPSADLPLVANAVAFGLRLNGGAVCMAPRRIFAMPATLNSLRPLLTASWQEIPPTRLPALIEVASLLHLQKAYAESDYALTASIFCSRADEPKARALAASLRAGVVLINDLIAPTADARVPFGGRGASGFGVTRGAEGLLEMTAVKTLIVRRGGAMRHLAATTNADVPLFDGMIRSAHARTWMKRFRGLRDMVAAARTRQK